MIDMQRRRLIVGGACTCGALALAGCAAPIGSGENISQGYKPAASSDEAGLWQVMETAEGKIKRSRQLIRNDEVNAYLHDIACRVGGNHCANLRLYLMRVPYFNASVAPNGMMQVYSGLLLRTQNEAQVAAVIGHEIGHYLRRHSLNRWRDVRSKADFGVFLGMGLALAGAPAGASQLANLLLIASIFAYTRDQEREADEIGLTLMAQAGYAPIEASKVWQQLIEEQEADPTDEERSLIFSTHPPSDERFETLRQRAMALSLADQQTYADRYRAQLRGIRLTLFDDELRLQQFSRSLALFDQLSREIPPDGDLLFAYGELYRLRDEAGDTAKALDAYRGSLVKADPPVEAWRGLGLVQRKRGERAAAAEAFERYLALAPEGPDRALIQRYLDEGA